MPGHSGLYLILDIDEQLLAAAREDNEDLILELIEQEDLDINYQDRYVDITQLTRM